MTKDEMKNRISMALKDPVLQQGFEIICKENAELDCQMNRNKYCYSCINATDRCFRKEIGCPCEKYKSYKDENAELKERLDDKDMAETDLATVAYMQGAERYKTKWHDLRKDPNDLPKHCRYVWTNVGPSYYDDDKDCPCWRDEFGRTQGVIAWCEPKFKE